MECMFPLSSATGRSVRKPHQLMFGMASSTKLPNGFFLLEKMKCDITFERMRSGDYLGDAKMSKRAPHSVKLNFFIICDGNKRFSQNERRRVDTQNFASDFLIFA